MKKYKIFITLILLFYFSEVYAATNPYQKNVSWGGINCTWYAWDAAYNRAGVALLPFKGNARNWYSEAQSKGYSVGETPKSKSIAVWDNYLEYGHVGYVESVKDNKIYVWDTNQCYAEMSSEQYDKWWECVNTKTTNESDMYLCDDLKVTKQIPCEYSGKVGDNKLIGFIYLDIPRQNIGTNSANTEKNNSNTNTTIKKEEKSSNNYLKGLIIKDIEFEFKKDIFEYNLEVVNDIESIEIVAELEDKKATIKYDKNYNLKIGMNNIVIVTTAENGNKLEYKININRLEKVEEPKEEDIKSVNTNDEKIDNSYSKYFKIYYLIIPATIIGIILIIVLINKKQKNVK